MIYRVVTFLPFTRLCENKALGSLCWFLSWGQAAESAGGPSALTLKFFRFLPRCYCASQTSLGGFQAAVRGAAAGGRYGSLLVRIFLNAFISVNSEKLQSCEETSQRLALIKFLESKPVGLTVTVVYYCWCEVQARSCNKVNITTLFQTLLSDYTKLPHDDVFMTFTPNYIQIKGAEPFPNTQPAP